MKQYFCYTPNDGMIYFETAEAAETRAREEIEIYRDAAYDDGEWDEDVFLICWGAVHQGVVATEEYCEDDGDCGQSEPCAVEMFLVDTGVKK